MPAPQEFHDSTLYLIRAENAVKIQKNNFGFLIFGF
jgi:hypothetical protein